MATVGGSASDSSALMCPHRHPACEHGQDLDTGSAESATVGCGHAERPELVQGVGSRRRNSNHPIIGGTIIEVHEGGLYLESRLERRLRQVGAEVHTPFAYRVVAHGSGGPRRTHNPCGHGKEGDSDGRSSSNEDGSVGGSDRR